MDGILGSVATTTAELGNQLNFALSSVGEINVKISAMVDASARATASGNAALASQINGQLQAAVQLQGQVLGQAQAVIAACAAEQSRLAEQFRIQGNQNGYLQAQCLYQMAAQALSQIQAQITCSADIAARLSVGLNVNLGAIFGAGLTAIQGVQAGLGSAVHILSHTIGGVAQSVENVISTARTLFANINGSLQSIFSGIT